MRYGQPQGPLTPVNIELQAQVSRLGRLIPIRRRWFAQRSYAQHGH
jgi:hypothetical protein